MNNKNLNTTLPKRLKPTSKTIKNLLLRSGNECAFANCDAVIFNDQNILIAECCHIEAAMPGGERYNIEQTDEERRAYENLVFLCPRHHTETNDVSLFTVDILRKIKTDHEEQYKEKKISIKPDYIKQVTNSFEIIKLNVEKTAEIATRIEKGQEKILEILQTSARPTETIKSNDGEIEFFGAPPIFQFKGRTEETSILDLNFEKYNTFIVAGISGIGKTSFLSNYVVKKNDFKIFWIDCDLITTLDALALRMHNFIKQEFGESHQKLISSTDYDILELTVLSILNRHRVIIVLDALNKANSEIFSLARYLNKSLSNSKIIISTNIAFESSEWYNPISYLNLKGLDIKAFTKILEVYKITNLSTDNLELLYNLLDGHPYLIKMVTAILEYEPIEELIRTLKNKNSQEISNFIKTKVYKFLSDEDLLFLKQIMLLRIPFRYSIGEFIFKDKFKAIFKSLKQKFIIEDFQEQFYIIPDFIRNYDLKYREESTDAMFENFINYLKSQDDPRFFEKKAIIYHALNGGFNDIAYKETIEVLSQLMAFGKFNIASGLANDLETNSVAKNWGILYFVQGRVHRFQESYEKALEKYNQGISVNTQNEFSNSLNFEKASMLMYLSQDDSSGKFKREAMIIYRKLSMSSDINAVVQSHTSIATDLVQKKKYKEAISSLENLIKLFESSNKIQNNVKAQVWQLLGEVYSKKRKYKKAFECFDNSCDYYKETDSSGMNIIDGLFHLYRNYAHTYCKCKHYFEAAQMYSICVRLADEFELPTRLETSLFDLGYTLILAEDFKSATKVLDNHYDLLLENNFATDIPMPIIYGTLLFAHWYDNDFDNAIELMALMIISYYRENKYTPIMVMESDGMNGKIDIIKFFQKRAYTLIIPSGKTHNDFVDWIENVCVKRPELAEPLSQFMYVKKE